MKKYITLIYFIFTFHLVENAFSQAAIYAGGPVYRERQYSIDELRNSGFSTVIVWTIHIQENGDLNFNQEFPLVKNGVYVGDQYYPEFPNDIRMLKTEPTSVTRVEFGISAAESKTFEVVKRLISKEGTGPESTLYKNFLALKNAIPGIDAFNNDDESTYDVESAVQFTIMLADLGFKNAIVPYQRSDFWQTLVKQVNEARPGNIDINYLQCYAGGQNNDPCAERWDLDIPIYPGLWGGGNHLSPKQVCWQLKKWTTECGIPGGFMWLYDDFKNSPEVNAFAEAINEAVE